MKNLRGHLKKIEVGLRDNLEKFRQSRYLQVILLVSLIGIGLRIYQFAALRSLWWDEAKLALNIIDRPMLELLFKPLEYDQGAPLLFLFVEKLFTLIFGRTDVVLRLFPFICGILTIPLSAYIATKVFGKAAGFITTVLVALNSPLIYYSSEAKQYAVDAFAVLFVIYVFIGVFEKKLSNRDYWKILAAGIFTSLLSHPSLFVFGGLAAALWIKTYIEARREKRLYDFYKLSGVLFAWGALYGVLYFVALRDLTNNASLLDFWSDGFMPMPPWRRIGWFRSLQYEFTDSFLPGYRKAYKLFQLMIALGFLLLWKKNKYFSIGAVIAAIGMLAASALRVYPLQGRLLTFTIPLVILFIGGGVQLFYDLFKDRKVITWSIASVLCIFVAYGSINNVLDYISTPEARLREEVKPLIDIVEKDRQENEPLYVYYVTSQVYQYYQTINNRHDHLVFYGANHRSEPELYIEEIEQLSDYSTIWVLFSRSGNLDEFIRNYLVEACGNLEEYPSYRAMLWKCQNISAGAN